MTILQGRAAVLAGLVTFAAIPACSTGLTDQADQESSRASNHPASSSQSVLVQSDYRIPAEAGTFTFVWSAEDGIDLHSRAAEIIRAQVESCALSPYGANAVYPGAEKAALDADITSSANCVRPYPRPLPSGNAFQGTIHAHIASIEATETSISAHVCETRSGRARHDPDHPPLDGTPEFDVLNGTRGKQIVAQKPADVADPRADAARVAQPGTGTREPRYNVFYPWVFPPFQLPTTKPPATPMISDPTCNRWAAEALTRIPAFAGQTPYNPDDTLRELTPKALGPEGFPTLPQYPLWPEPPRH